MESGVRRTLIFSLTAFNFMLSPTDTLLHKMTQEASARAATASVFILLITVHQAEPAGAFHMAILSRSQQYGSVSTASGFPRCTISKGHCSVNSFTVMILPPPFCGNVVPIVHASDRCSLLVLRSLRLLQYPLPALCRLENHRSHSPVPEVHLKSADFP